MPYADPQKRAWARFFSDLKRGRNVQVEPNGTNPFSVEESLRRSGGMYDMRDPEPEGRPAERPPRAPPRVPDGGPTRAPVAAPLAAPKRWFDHIFPGVFP